MTTVVVSTTLSAVALISEEQVNEENFEAATTVAQIFSGIVFAGLGVWMLISNGTKMSYIQRASLEKRLGTCCAIDTYVALFSSFFNFFQLTEVDDLFLPRPGGFTLDFSRPIEWIVTCPMMQVVLVLMGGSRIPEYRRVLMPSLSLAVLSCGTTSMLLAGPIRFGFYALGFTIAMVMFFLNAKQILEHSNDQENIWVGDSEFRKASLLLIVTWFPFPLWFFVSPEGVGLIDNVLIIQMGWAFLNILSKFTFIFYIQRVKDNYCNRLKVRRELLGVNGGNQNDGVMDVAALMGMKPKNPFAEKERSKEKELAAVVVETMTFLGMAQHNDRFLKLLRDAKVSTVEMVEVLTKEQSDSLQLPWDLVSALQKRIKVWRLEMTDNAELELEKGEAHYLASTPAPGEGGMMGLVPGEVPEGNPDDVRSAIARALMGGGGGGDGMSQEFAHGLQNQLTQITDMMGMLQQQIEHVNEASLRRQSEMENSLKWQMEQFMGGRQGESDRVEQLIAQSNERNDEAISNLGRSMAAKMDSLQASMQRYQAENESGFLQKINQIMTKQSEASADALANTLQAKMDMAQAAALRQNSELGDNMMQTLEGVVRQVNASGKVSEESSEMARTVQSRMDDLQSRQLKQLEDNIHRKVEGTVEDAVNRFERSVQGIRTGVQGDVEALNNGNNLVAETVRTTSDTQMEGLADLRRLSMMVLEQSSASLEKTQSGFGKMDVLQGTVDTGLGRILEKLGAGADAHDWAPSAGPTTPGGRPMSARAGGSSVWRSQGATSPEGSRRPSQTASGDGRGSNYGRVNG